MNEIIDRFEVGYRFDSLIELNDIAQSQEDTDLLPLYEECDIWARRALAANGFGDY